MASDTFPFPGRDLANQELTRDVCFSKIPRQDRGFIVKKAWCKGEQAAKDVFERYNGESDFFKIAADNNLNCECIDRDYISGNQRYFSEYISAQNRVIFYLGAIRLWALEQGMTLEKAMNIILSHEYFHFLEWTKLGLTSREYQVPMLRMGPLSLGKTGIRALSEIGAHAFSCTYFELIREKEQQDETIGI